MNFMGKSSGGGGNSGSRQQQPEEEEEEERQNTGPTGRLFPSSSSSSPSSSHLHHHQQQHQNQQPQFHNQQPYNPPGGWMFDGSTLAEPSSRPSEPEPMASTNDDEPQQGMMMVVEREHMFDKVVTPSDVGKLNRLVIPKQHAERYFPLDSSTNDKGLLLNFEDRNGKPWRFRYSYWNSSQSYVMTKGWSRFVKDKKLDAGDIVSFQRGVGGLAKDRLFIDWRHRPDAGPNPAYHHHHRLPLQHHQFSFHNRNVNNLHPWNPVFLQSQAVGSRSQSSLMVQPYGAPSGPYGSGSVVNMNPSGSGSVIYFRPAGQQQHQLDMMGMQHRSGVGMGMGMGIGIDPHTLPPAPAPAAVGGQPGMVFESVPVVHGKAAAKRLRLFGVNMDCPIPDDDDDQDYDPTSQLSPTMVPSSTSINPIHMRNYYLHNHPPTLSSSSSTIPYVQLRPYEQDYEPQFRQNTVISSSSTDAFNKNNKSSSSSHMSLDLDI